VPSLSSRTSSPRGTLKVLIVGITPDKRAAAREVLASLSEPPLEIEEASPSPSATASTKPSEAVDVTMVVFDGAEEAALNYVQERSAHSPRPVILALVNGKSPIIMKRALRAGADEIIFLPLDAGDATRVLLKISEDRWRAERRDGCVILSMTSVVGGVGVTSLAANIGLALRHVFDQRVALVDLNLQTGGLSVSLNLEPEVTMLPLARLDQKMDSIQLESALTKHPSGLYLLAAPKRIEECELISDITVGTILELMRQLFDYVIVDCGGHIDEIAVAAWERSDHLFYVLKQTVISARSAWRFIDLYERLGISTLEPRFVLNNFQPAHPLGDKQIEATLGRSIFARIPSDSRAMERTELTAADIFESAPNSQVARAITDLTRKIMPVNEAAASEQSGMLSRLFSALGGR
jgi:pilus assembly protein CpaE